MSSRRVVVVGDVVLDRDLVGHVERLCPDAPAPVVDVSDEHERPGAAGLAALASAAAGAQVTLVAPMADDAEAGRLRRLLAAAGVDVIALRQDGSTRQKTRIRVGSQSLARVDRGGPARPVGGLPEAAAVAVDSADVVLVSCYGAGTSQHEGVRQALASRAGRRPVVWDPHPRGGDPVSGCTVVTPNLAEGRGRAGMPGAPGDEVARHLLARWDAGGVAVTGGAEGAWLATSASETLFVPATPVDGDPCGAGDCFAATTAVSLAAGRTPSEAVTAAVEAATAFVAHGAAPLSAALPRLPHGPAVAARGVPHPFGAPRLDALELAQRVRAHGGRVVATGGCFDLLHAGHVRCLEAARRLGDALVVLLNSDASARRLKGPGRPVHCAEDRVRVLEGLGCVDAVLVFDEDDPRDALDVLRPDVWAKGGDYEDASLPEGPLVRSWGGRVVLLPYLSGRSTTAILNELRWEHA